MGWHNLHEINIKWSDTSKILQENNFVGLGEIANWKTDFVFASLHSEQSQQTALYTLSNLK